MGPFSNSIRPFTVNGTQTLCFVNVNELLGFEVGDLRTGKMLHRVEIPGVPRGPVKRHGCPSHGIGMTPNEQEIWVSDGHNSQMHIFDATVMPPRWVAHVELREQPGWVTFSLDGSFAYPSTGEVFDVATRQIVARLSDERGREVHSEKMLEIDFQEGHPLRQWGTNLDWDVAAARRNSGSELRLGPHTMYTYRILFSIAFTTLAVGMVRADWPTFQHDNAHSGATDEALPNDPVPLWSYQSPSPPRTAWDEPALWDGWSKVHNLTNRQVYDKALHVAVVDGAVYFGSSVDDKLYCLDATTGESRWQFFTEGPLRLRPPLSMDGCTLAAMTATSIVWTPRPVTYFGNMPLGATVAAFLVTNALSRLGPFAPVSSCKTVACIVGPE